MPANRSRKLKPKHSVRSRSNQYGKRQPRTNPKSHRQPQRNKTCDQTPPNADYGTTNNEHTTHLASALSADVDFIGRILHYVQRLHNNTTTMTNENGNTNRSTSSELPKWRSLRPAAREWCRGPAKETGSTLGRQCKAKHIHKPIEIEKERYETKAKYKLCEQQFGSKETPLRQQRTQHHTKKVKTNNQSNGHSYGTSKRAYREDGSGHGLVFAHAVIKQRIFLHRKRS